MLYTTQKLARYITRFQDRDLTPQTMASVQKCLVDVMGAALVGCRVLPPKVLGRLGVNYFKPGEAVIWFSTEKLPAAAAALVNSAAASALDLDDGHRAALGHPGASIIPAAIAVAQEVAASGPALISAIALGYEIAVRIAAARDIPAQDTLSTGRWCAYGAVAAAGRLYGTPAEELAQALAIAGVQSPGLSAAGYSTLMGNHVKEGIPWATFTGLMALQLATAGFNGPLDLLDHPAYYDARRITHGLLTDDVTDAQLDISWAEHFRAIENVYFKPYSCCRWIHSALEALHHLIREHDLSGEDLQRIEVHTFERALRLNNETDPKTLEGAQYSINFCLAVLALEGSKALLPLEASLLGRADLTALAQKVSLHLDDAMDRRFPAQTGARVVLATPVGRLEAECRHPVGDPANPMSFDQLVAKFQTLTRPYKPLAWQETLVQAVKDLPLDGPKALFACLGCSGS